MPQPQPIHNLRLRQPHLRFFFWLGVVVTEEMQNAVDDKQARLVREGVACGLGLRVGAGDGEDDIAKVGRARIGVRFGGGEGEYVRRRVDSQKVPIEAVELLVIREDDGEVAFGVLMSQRGEGSLFEQVEVKGRFEGGFNIDHGVFTA